MARFHVQLLVLFLCICTCWYMSVTDLEFQQVHLDDVSTSDVLKTQYLLCLRTLFFIVIFLSTTYIVLDKRGLEITVSLSNGESKMVTLQHYQRMYTFTVWCWIAQGMYFIASATCSVMSLWDASAVSPFLIGSTVVLFEISFALAYLVTVLVSFVLIPAAISRKIPHKFFEPIPVLFHNANALFMAVDIVLNKITMRFSHIAFIQLFGLAYVLFAWNLHSRSGIFFYFFLDYDRPYAILWYAGLFVGVGVMLNMSYHVISCVSRIH